MLLRPLSQPNVGPELFLQALQGYFVVQAEVSCDDTVPGFAYAEAAEQFLWRELSAYQASDVRQIFASQFVHFEK